MVSIARLLLVFLFISSCAKLGYLYDQGIGQIKLLNSGIDNKDVLKDKSISKRDKHKIQKIIEYKNFFYHFWGKKPADIYEQTVFLSEKAVTYLVITSPYNKVEALKECFLVAGCFPYLGFFF